MKPEGRMQRQEDALGWKINIISYKLSGRYYCAVDNVDPGGRIAWAEGSTREEAERQAVEEAKQKLSETRRFARR